MRVPEKDVGNRGYCLTTIAWLYSVIAPQNDRTGTHRYYADVMPCECAGEYCFAHDFAGLKFPERDISVPSWAQVKAIGNAVSISGMDRGEEVRGIPLWLAPGP